MTFRTRVLLAFVPVVLVPLLVFGLGVRRAVRDRIAAQYRRRVDALVAVIREDFAERSRSIAGRLAALKAAATDDNRLRGAAVQTADRQYLLDYAGTAMRLGGLDMLQIQDGAGRIVSSGHFRQEFDRLEPALPRLVASAPGGVALVEARTAEGRFLALVRVDSLRLAGQQWTLVGGTTVDAASLAGLARDTTLRVVLELSGAAAAPPPAPAGAASDTVVGELQVPFVESDSGRLAPARIVVTAPLTALAEVRRSVDFWFLVAALATLAVAVVVGGWLASRVTQPLADLAGAAAAVDLERLETAFASDRPDEIGALTRLLGEMTARLRAGAARLREIERRAAMGDLARQVNHDIKNGLAPLRNVLRHLAEVARDSPSRLPAVLAERRETLESSLAYLETLAANYARLYPETRVGPCEVNDVVRETLRLIAPADGITLGAELVEGLPRVRADALVLRRILENLVRNAVEAMDGRGGAVTVRTERLDGARLRITVVDQGKGMSQQELARVFDDFYTTKPGGTGLGLSIVRRLVLDLSGSLKVETEPGQGTRFFVELPGEEQ
jgi:two-component system, NtrC family, nitrogen regulation sensor histidine kinase NtrY